MGAIRQGENNVGGVAWSKSNSKVVASTSGIPIITYRNNSTFAGTANRVGVEPHSLSVSVTGGQNVTFEVWKNPAVDGGTYTDLNTDTSVVSTNPGPSERYGGRPIFTVLQEGTTSDHYDLSDTRTQLLPGDVLRVTGQSASATPTVGIAVGWLEYQ